MMSAPIQHHVDLTTSKGSLVARAENLTIDFVKIWTTNGAGIPAVFWRYWPEPYCRGWTESDEVSASRPKQKPRDMAAERYMDVNHPGISLLGLSDMNNRFSTELKKETEQTLQNLINQTPFLARDLDGNGPVSPRWLPGEGWHLFEGKELPPQTFFVVMLG